MTFVYFGGGRAPRSSVWQPILACCNRHHVNSLDRNFLFWWQIWQRQHHSDKYDKYDDKTPVWHHSDAEDRMEVELWSERPDEKKMMLLFLDSRWQWHLPHWWNMMMTLATLDSRWLWHLPRWWIQDKDDTCHTDRIWWWHLPHWWMRGRCHARWSPLPYSHWFDHCYPPSADNNIIYTFCNCLKYIQIHMLRKRQLTETENVVVSKFPDPLVDTWLNENNKRY